MPDEAPGTAADPHTLAGKIQFLRDLTTPKGDPPLSYEKMAAAIAEQTHHQMSGAHIFNLATGHQKNPKIADVRALATYFRVPVGYLVGDGGDYRRLDTELELLGALKRRDVTEITVEGDSDAPVDPSVVRAVLRQIDKLSLFGDAHGRTIIESLASLSDERCRTVEEIIANPALLDALGTLLASPETINALTSQGVPEIVTAIAGLSAASREAVAAIITQLSHSQGD